MAARPEMPRTRVGSLWHTYSVSINIAPLGSTFLTRKEMTVRPLRSSDATLGRPKVVTSRRALDAAHAPGLLGIRHNWGSARSRADASLVWAADHVGGQLAGGRLLLAAHLARMQVQRLRASDPSRHGDPCATSRARCTRAQSASPQITSCVAHSPGPSSEPATANHRCRTPEPARLATPRIRHNTESGIRARDINPRQVVIGLPVGQVPVRDCSRIATASTSRPTSTGTELQR